MKKYFYTNQMLVDVLDIDNDGIIDWEKHGFSVREIRKAIRKGFQKVTGDGEVISVLPISDEPQFNKMLGGLIVVLDTEEINKVIDESEALEIVKRF